MSIDSGESSIQPGSPGVANGVSAQVGQSAATVDQTYVCAILLATSPRGVPLSMLHLVEISKMIGSLDLGGCAVVLGRGSSTWSSLVPDCVNKKSRKARPRQYTRVETAKSILQRLREASLRCWEARLRLSVRLRSVRDRRSLLSWAGCSPNGKAVRVEHQTRGQNRELGPNINGPTKQTLANEGQGTSTWMK
ncbi:hypothetical protein BN1708_014999 [Verticillium longisporum]|uniref:Uncharacterized protein n=1 Tax=Verticillium longisporum TaxID=100787 RepID=A0A0G4M263_VERLO|nr:hypothetical protein BN1708_014999 [Verticillium longisporum]